MKTRNPAGRRRSALVQLAGFGLALAVNLCIVGALALHPTAGQRLLQARCNAPAQWLARGTVVAARLDRGGVVRRD